MPAPLHRQPAATASAITSGLEAKLESKLVAAVLGKASTAIIGEEIEQGAPTVEVQSVHTGSQVDGFSEGKQLSSSVIEVEGELRVPFNVKISLEHLTELLTSAALDADGRLTQGDA